MRAGILGAGLMGASSARSSLSLDTTVGGVLRKRVGGANREKATHASREDDRRLRAEAS